MKLRTAGTLAAVAVIAFSACNRRRAHVRRVVRRHRRQPAACENKKVVLEHRDPCTRACRARRTNTARPTRSSSRSGTLEAKKVGNFDQVHGPGRHRRRRQRRLGRRRRAVHCQHGVRADPDAMGSSAHYNSGAAKLTIPILNEACLVMISPANTYPGLTRRGTSRVSQTATTRAATQLRPRHRHGRRAGRGRRRVGQAPWRSRPTSSTTPRPSARASRNVEWRRSSSTSVGHIPVVSRTAASIRGLRRQERRTTGRLVAQRSSRPPAPTSSYIGSITGQNTGKLVLNLGALCPDTRSCPATACSRVDKFNAEYRHESGNGTATRLRRRRPAMQILLDAGKRGSRNKTARGGDSRRRTRSYGPPLARSPSTR